MWFLRMYVFDRHLMNHNLPSSLSVENYDEVESCPVDVSNNHSSFKEMAHWAI